MSDLEPPRPPTDQPPVAPAPPPVAAPTGYPPVPYRQPPERLGGAYYSVGLVILLTIVTIGIWGALWTYRTSEDLKRWNGDGLGGVLGVVIYILLSPVLMFTIPNEIRQMYERDNRQSPISAVWGLWILLPLIGHIIWYVKTQNALNDFWLNKGSAPG